MAHAFIQARMSSTRLPGKVLLPIEGDPILLYMINRVLKAKLIDKVIVVTSVEKSDLPIVELCKNNNISCYRGSLNDVLDRYYQAAVENDSSIIVRLTSDCPLIDPEVIDTLIRCFTSGSYDYVANTVPPETTTFPDGMDVEVFSFKALERAWREAKKPSDREHVTFYLWKNGDKFQTHRVDLKENLSSYRFTIDYPEDLEAIRLIVKHFIDTNPDFRLMDIIDFVKNNPKVIESNSNKIRNQGWNSAFEKDRQQGF